MASVHLSLNLPIGKSEDRIQILSIQGAARKPGARPSVTAI